MARRAKAPLQQAVRARLAITEAFNPMMQFFCQIIISRPIYGWKGFARHQPEKGGNLIYMGGAEQIYLPNLVSAYHSVSSDYAYIHHFGAADSLG